jgi:hypothetical protein
MIADKKDPTKKNILDWHGIYLDGANINTNDDGDQFNPDDSDVDVGQGFDIKKII